MKRYSMFLDSKNQNYENDSTTQAIYRFNAIPIKLPIAFFTELEQNISQFLRTRIAKAILLRKMELEKSTFLTSDYTTKLQSSREYGAGKKTPKTIDQWNKRESPEINPCTYGYLIFEKGGKNVKWDKENLFN